METEATLHRRKVRDYQMLMRSYNSKVECLLYDIDRKDRENEELNNEKKELEK